MVDNEYEDEYEPSTEDDITYIEELEREEIKALENEENFTPGVDMEEENLPDHINKRKFRNQ